MITSYSHLLIIIFNIGFGIFIHLCYCFFFFKTHRFNSLLEVLFWIILLIIYIKILDNLVIEFIYLHLLFIGIGAIISYYTFTDSIKKQTKNFLTFFNTISKKVIHILKVISIPTPFIMIYQYIKKQIYKHKHKKNWKELF